MSQSFVLCFINTPVNVNHQGPPLRQTKGILTFKKFCENPHLHFHLLCQNPRYFLPQEVGISLF